MFDMFATLKKTLLYISTWYISHKSGCHDCRGHSIYAFATLFVGNENTKTLYIRGSLKNELSRGFKLNMSFT